MCREPERERLIDKQRKKEKKDRPHKTDSETGTERERTLKLNMAGNQSVSAPAGIANQPNSCCEVRSEWTEIFGPPAKCFPLKENIYIFLCLLSIHN